MGDGMESVWRVCGRCAEVCVGDVCGCVCGGSVCKVCVWWGSVWRVCGGCVWEGGECDMGRTDSLRQILLASPLGQTNDYM